MGTQAIKDTIADYFSGQPVLKAWLFGSYSRGEETPESDVDVLVEYDRSQPVGLMRISRMQLALQGLLGLPVDLVDSEMLYPRVAEQVNRNKQLIYERTPARP